MTRFSDELRGSEGERAMIQSTVQRRAIIRAVHDGGERVTVQFEDDGTCSVARGLALSALSWQIVHFKQVELEGDEA